MNMHDNQKLGSRTDAVLCIFSIGTTYLKKELLCTYCRKELIYEGPALALAPEAASDAPLHPSN